MNKSKYIILTIILLLFNINNVYAECTKDDLIEFSKVEEKYNITSEYDIVSNSYILTIYSVLPDKYDYNIHMDNNGNSVCEKQDDNITKCFNVPPDQELDVEIIGQTSSCDKTFKQYTITLSKINEFFDDPLCEGIEEFYLCQPTVEEIVDYETFQSRVETYKRTKQKELEENKEEDDIQFIDKLKDYILNHIEQIIIIIFFTILIIVNLIILIKKMKKRRRLE